MSKSHKVTISTTYQQQNLKQERRTTFIIFILSYFHVRYMHANMFNKICHDTGGKRTLSPSTFQVEDKVFKVQPPALSSPIFFNSRVYFCISLSTISLQKRNIISRLWCDGSDLALGIKMRAQPPCPLSAVFVGYSELHLTHFSLMVCMNLAIFHRQHCPLLGEWTRSFVSLAVLAPIRCTVPWITQSDIMPWADLFKETISKQDEGEN